MVILIIVIINIIKKSKASLSVSQEIWTDRHLDKLLILAEKFKKFLTAPQPNPL